MVRLDDNTKRKIDSNIDNNLPMFHIEYLTIAKEYEKSRYIKSIIYNNKYLAIRGDFYYPNDDNLDSNIEEIGNNSDINYIAKTSSGVLVCGKYENKCLYNVRVVELTRLVSYGPTALYEMINYITNTSGVVDRVEVHNANDEIMYILDLLEYVPTCYEDDITIFTKQIK